MFIFIPIIYNYSCFGFFSRLFIEYFYTAGAGINVAKAMFNIVSGLNAGPVRLPLTDLSQEQKQKLKEKIDSTGIFK